MKLSHLQFYVFSRLTKGQQSPLRLPSFNHFPLHESINKFLQERDIHTPTYIQYAYLTHLFSQKGQKNNLVSPTGSGKTLAYTLPIVDYLKKQQSAAEMQLTRVQRPRALIITTAKQLVLQGKNVAKDVSHFAKLKCEGLGIGRTLNEQKQKMKEGVDILISGFLRYKRMVERKQIFQSNLSWIVVDQADTLLQSQKTQFDKLFQTVILPKMQSEIQPKLIFSSTTNPPALKQYLQKKLPKLTQFIDKNTHVNLQNIKHQFLYCQSYNKHDSLLQQIKRDRKTKIMVFCNSVSSLHQLQYFLNEQGFPSMTLHSQLSKQARIRNYQYFRDCQFGILLSTDLGARGLDIPKLNKIVNYDFPLSTCDYLQRAGRTGRAGQKGTVISIYFKKHLPIIDQLRNASFSSPLKIKNSAYGFNNRQQTHRPHKFTK